MALTPSHTQQRFRYLSLSGIRATTHNRNIFLSNWRWVYKIKMCDAMRTVYASFVNFDGNKRHIKWNWEWLNTYCVLYMSVLKAKHHKWRRRRVLPSFGGFERKCWEYRTARGRTDLELSQLGEFFTRFDSTSTCIRVCVCVRWCTQVVDVE